MTNSVGKVNILVVAGQCLPNKAISAILSSVKLSVLLVSTIRWQQRERVLSFPVVDSDVCRHRRVCVSAYHTGGGRCLSHL